MAESAISPVGDEVTESALEAWGRAVGGAVASGTLSLPLVIALRGPLGAGKSVLARAIARGAGVESPMPSPTYNLRFTYEVGGETGAAEGFVVQHLDLYRLEDPEDVWELGWQELGTGRELMLIEWPGRAEALLPPDRWEAVLGLLDDPASAHLRSFRVEPRGRVPAPPIFDGTGPAGDVARSRNAAEGQ